MPEDKTSVSEYIRSSHPYAFRSGEWAQIVARATDPENDRECYFLRFEDGTTDIWPVHDPVAQYEFREA